MEAVWKTVRGQLSIVHGDEFERAALHYLRVIWPSMIQAPRLLRLDRFGVDLCVPDSSSYFQIVVQAKGFKVDEQLLETQVRKQILPSIKKFHDSPLTCDEYVLLHNRDGANRQLADEIQLELDKLVHAGKAKVAYQWDRFHFIKEVRNRIDGRMREKLLARSQTILQQQERFFHYGGLFVSQVPVGQSTWKPGAPVQSDFDKAPYSIVNAAKLIASPRKVRYAILIESFGIGKTTTVLHAAAATGLSVVYVPAHTIHRRNGSQGTNYFLRNVNDELELLADLPADSAEVLRDVVGASLGRILRQANDQFVLVIDGLDEHGFYGTAYGLQWLTNELAELRCPIVLTTRREHFLSLIGNYELAAQNLSRKGGANRIIDVLQLGSWTPVQASELLQRAIDITQNESLASSMRQLLKRITSESTTLSARLLQHPLFLQMTLDLIVDGEDWLVADDDQLMEIWARKKIQRDLLMPRLHTNSMLDVDFYVDSMMLAMSRIALEMQAASGDVTTPTEMIDSEKVVEIVREAMDIPELDAATILTTSFLVPASMRRGRILDVKFFHRSFQDFFVKRAKGLFQ